MGDKRSTRPQARQPVPCLLVAVLVLFAYLYTASDPSHATRDADDGTALKLARNVELDVELQSHAAARDAARGDVAVARAKAEGFDEAPPQRRDGFDEAPPQRRDASLPPPPPPIGKQRREPLAVARPAPARAVTTEKEYTGYTFWSSDFHISPVADLKDLFQPMGMRIIDESLSGHCHLKKTCSRNLKVITKQNGITLGQCPNQLRRKFFAAYVDDPRMKSVDAFLCHHAAGLCEAFMPFNKSLLVIASTRYEIGRHDPRRWRAWNANLKAIAAHPRNVVAANNRYDAEYVAGGVFLVSSRRWRRDGVEARRVDGVEGHFRLTRAAPQVKYFTGLAHVPVLPNYCGYTGATYKPTRRQILIGPGRGVKDHFLTQIQEASRNKKFRGQPMQFKRIRDLYPHFEYGDLAAHPCIVLIPYQVSLMSIFEYYRMGIPLWAPSPQLLAAWQMSYGVMSERTWDLVRKKRPTRGSPLPRAPGTTYAHDPNDELSKEAIAFWIKYADFYEWPHIRTFDSFEDLVTQLADPALDLDAVSASVRAYNAEMVRDLKSEWRALFARMFRGLEPASVEPRVQKRGYDEALMAKYGARQADRCVGDAFDGAAADGLAA